MNGTVTIVFKNGVVLPFPDSTHIVETQDIIVFTQAGQSWSFHRGDVAGWGVPINEEEEKASAE